MRERIHKILAHAGVGSRRACEKMIVDGRVSINGHVVKELGSCIDPRIDKIDVDGSRVIISKDTHTFMVNKPCGVVTSMRDEKGRTDLSTLADRIGYRVYHIGRLDEQTSGLLLMSNDGELAHRVMHPSYELPKTYLATLKGRIRHAQVAQLVKPGIDLDDGHAQADSCSILSVQGHQSMVKIVIHMGRHRIVRRMFHALGFPVLQLARTRLGPLSLGDLRIGEYRELTPEERKLLDRDLHL